MIGKTRNAKRAVDPAVRKFSATLLKLARKTPGEIDAYLCCAEDSCKVDSTSTTLRCHVIRQDMSGTVRVDALVERLSQLVIDYAIPRSKIKEAHASQKATGSTQPMMALRQEANELFTPAPLSGEGGELMLFWLTENVLGLPQILCKMPLKTNARLHYNGVDGVHADAGIDGTLSMVWGEAKLYKAAKEAIDECFASLTPYVSGPVSGNAAKRDLALLRDNVDLANPKLEATLKEYLKRDSTKNLKLKYRGACLAGFNLSPYPTATHAATTAMVKNAMHASLATWTKHVSNAIGHNNVPAIDIDIFVVPMPSVADFRIGLRKKLGLD